MAEQWDSDLMTNFCERASKAGIRVAKPTTAPTTSTKMPDAAKIEQSCKTMTPAGNLASAKDVSVPKSASKMTGGKFDKQVGEVLGPVDHKELDKLKTIHTAEEHSAVVDGQEEFKRHCEGLGLPYPPPGLTGIRWA